MSQIDYSSLANVLVEAFHTISEEIPPDVRKLLLDENESLNTIFNSKTQSYREVLLGCTLIHYCYPDINIRLPYIKQGPRSFNGRTVDEQVVNPFLMSRQIPCSKGPYLATFRRNVTFTEATRDGLRDKDGYDAMLSILDKIEVTTSTGAYNYLLCLLQKFIELRERSIIELMSVDRLSLEQSTSFINMLLRNNSGGLIPVLITEAIFKTINTIHQRNWQIIRQGINAADGAVGVPGDITLYSETNHVFKAIEVTERPISKSRVTATFNTKISRNHVREYLFIYTSIPPEETAYEEAEKLFPLGYNVGFIKLSNLVQTLFIVENEETRNLFMRNMLELLKQDDIPASVKTAWNDSLQHIIHV